MRQQPRSSAMPILLAAILAALTGCSAAGIELEAITATPDSSPTSPPTPEPVPALNPDHVWIAAETQATEVLTVSAEGETTRTRLPLNEGQTASNVVASADGRYLAYLVWSDGGTQERGIAVWPLIEPNARLIVQPLPGYRVISLMFAADSSALLFVQVPPGLPNDVAWRLESVPPGGGPATLLADRESAPGILGPEPFAWPEGGPIYLNALARDAGQNNEAVLQGIYALDPATGEVALVSPLADRIITDGALSPDGSKLAYTTYDGPLPGEEGSTATPVVARVLDLESGEVTTLAAPEGGSVISVAWLPDGDHVLLDFLAVRGERESQTFALVEVGRAPPWPELPPDAGRAQLFTYLPYRGGVAYTVYPPESEAPWELTLSAEIATDATPQIVPLERLADGAPRIIRAP